MDNHTPVLLDEVLRYLDPQPGQVFVDATFGFGGHTKAIAERLGPSGKLVAIDYDPRAVERAHAMGKPTIAVEGNFANLSSLVHHVLPDSSINGVLLDCGISSVQLSDASLGLSFALEGPLAMRLNRTSGMTAADIINSWTEQKLTSLFQDYGQERAAARIARAIVSARREHAFTTTTQLADVVVRAVGRRGRIHPATRIFQALRIMVNDELTNLKKGIAEALSLLTVGGRLAVISFHSIEDRIVKQAFRDAARTTPNFSLLTKHTVPPTRAEILRNPRSRSAKLRVIERIPYVAA